jgi:pimeloyl-ACP methyl ester carboxylesterase
MPGPRRIDPSGRPGRGTVLLLPSYGCDTRVWGSFAHELARRFRVVPVTYPGHGGSPRPVIPIDTVAAAQQAAEQMPAAGAVIASGDGAAGAVWLARQGLATSLVLFSPTPHQLLPEVEFDYESTLVNVLDDFGWVAEVTALTDPSRRRRAVAVHQAALFVDKVPAGDLGRLRQMFEDNADLVLDPDLRAMVHLDWADDLPAVHVPVLVIATSDDGDIPVRVAAAVASRLPDAQFLRLDPPHTAVPWLGDPVATARIVVDFLELTTRSPGTEG